MEVIGLNFKRGSVVNWRFVLTFRGIMKLSSLLQVTAECDTYRVSVRKPSEGKLHFYKVSCLMLMVCKATEKAGVVTQVCPIV